MKTKKSANSLAITSLATRAAPAIFSHTHTIALQSFFARRSYAAETPARIRCIRRLNHYLTVSLGQETEQSIIATAAIAQDWQQHQKKQRRMPKSAFDPVDPTTSASSQAENHSNVQKRAPRFVSQRQQQPPQQSARFAPYPPTKPQIQSRSGGQLQQRPQKKFDGFQPNLYWRAITSAAQLNRMLRFSDSRSGNAQAQLHAAGAASTDYFDRY